MKWSVLPGAVPCGAVASCQIPAWQPVAIFHADNEKLRRFRCREHCIEPFDQAEFDAAVEALIQRQREESERANAKPLAVQSRDRNAGFVPLVAVNPPAPRPVRPPKPFFDLSAEERRRHARTTQ
jgi:hypothetical protein